MGHILPLIFTQNFQCGFFGFFFFLSNWVLSSCDFTPQDQNDEIAFLIQIYELCIIELVL